MDKKENSEEKPDYSDFTKWMEIEPEHYIPIPPNKLIEVLVEDVEIEDRPYFLQICKILQLLIQQKYHSTSEKLKESYAIFDPENKDHKYEISKTEIKKQEDKFLDSFFEVMNKANFSLLSTEELENAQSTDYLFTLPIELKFDNLMEDY
eukprot:TRINITY_DN6167_c0_g2_i1.p2 TRINITY_DN6167_c0_g2~~TRINITY_DN6167_c0_g2_i1.p2  ORF type:complete len:150 (-),score=47.70 TRINITY_DN6167_c0_g2_i1:682-1131(-)